MRIFLHRKTSQCFAETEAGLLCKRQCYSLPIQAHLNFFCFCVINPASMLLLSNLVVHLAISLLIPQRSFHDLSGKGRNTVRNSSQEDLQIQCQIRKQETQPRSNPQLRNLFHLYWYTIWPTSKNCHSRVSRTLAQASDFTWRGAVNLDDRLCTYYHCFLDQVHTVKCVTGPFNCCDHDSVICVVSGMLLDHNDLYHTVTPHNLFHTGTLSLILQKNLEVTNIQTMVFQKESSCSTRQSNWHHRNNPQS